MNNLTRLVNNNLKKSSCLLSHVDKTSLVKYSQICKFSIISVLNSGTRENINIGTIGNFEIKFYVLINF